MVAWAGWLFKLSIHMQLAGVAPQAQQHMGRSAACGARCLCRCGAGCSRARARLMHPCFPVCSHVPRVRVPAIKWILPADTYVLPCHPVSRKCSHVPRVRVPAIKWEATSRRVITMEWIDGVKLTDEKGGWHSRVERVCMPGRVHGNGPCVCLGVSLVMPCKCRHGSNLVRQAEPAATPCTPSAPAVTLCHCTPPLRTAAMSALGLDIVDFVTVGIECTLRQLLEAGFFHAGAFWARCLRVPALHPCLPNSARCAGTGLARRSRLRGTRPAACAGLPPSFRRSSHWARNPSADPHPGNLLATTNGDLVYLDFGMMSEAPLSGE